MQRNIGDWERLLSVAAGAAMVAYTMTRRRRDDHDSATWLTSAAGLIGRGVTGFCPVSALLGRNARRADTRTALAGSRGIHVHEVITIDRPADELYRFWRNLSNLPRFMDHLEQVEVHSSRRSVWTARAPAGMSVRWEAEVINDIDGELIGWRSTANADVATAGSVRFTPMPGGGTQIVVRLQYEPPAGRLGAWVASLFGEEPSQQIRSDLRKLKMLLETNDFARDPARRATGLAESARRDPDPQLA